MPTQASINTLNEFITTCDNIFDVEELQKTIYDLKKQVKELQTKLNIAGASDLLDDEKSGKKAKK